ncbi:MAG: hypothetical protein QHJ73_16530, partial [Armatimonadota bacterium]|nr:hypothetical protein [Armatimonadota bacterium]
ETHLWPWAVRAKIGRARFPILCANVRGPQAGCVETRHPLYRPCALLQAGAGVRVAVIGLTVPMVTPASAACRFSRYCFDDPIDTARQWVQQWRGRADVLVGLTHLGIDQDRLLAAAVPELHVIVGGHSHTCLQAPEMVHGVPILHAGCHGRYVGRAEVTLCDGRIDLRWKLVPLKAA